MKVDNSLLYEKEKTGRKKTGNVLYSIMTICVVLAGIGLISYPTVANWYNETHMAKMVADYDNVSQDLSEETRQEMFAAAEAYNQTLYGMTDRWGPDETSHEQYEGTLDVTGTGIMASIEIPGIGVKLPIYHGTEETTLMVGVGHHEGSSLPVGTKGGHVVLSGHSALPSARLFTDLVKVKTGDMFYISVLNDRLAYQVREINTVLPDEYEYFSFEENADLVTLMTCTPYGVNSHRLLVTGERIEDVPDDTDSTAEDVEIPSMDEAPSDKGMPVFLIFIFPAVPVAAIFIIMKRKKR